MKSLVKLYDEIDDLVGPVFAMAGIADLLCGAGLIASIIGGLVLGSLKTILAGSILSGLVVAATEWWPRLVSGQSALRPARQLR